MSPGLGIVSKMDIWSAVITVIISQSVEANRWYQIQKGRQFNRESKERQRQQNSVNKERLDKCSILCLCRSEIRGCQGNRRYQPKSLNKQRQNKRQKQVSVRKQLPVSWEIYVQVKKQQLELDMEKHTGSKLGKEYIKAVYRHPAHLT